MDSQSSQNFNLSGPETQGRTDLRAWALLNGRKMYKIAASIGVSPSALSKLSKAVSIPTRRHEQLVGEGVPAEVLPPAKDLSPGPPPGTRKGD